VEFRSVQQCSFKTILIAVPANGVADLGYEGLNMQVRETSIHKTSGFSSYFFHTLIKQRPANN
jgi:hypothetical protein